MKYGKIKDIIQKAKDASLNPETLQLAEAFEELMLLYEARPEIKEAEDWITYSKRVRESRAKVADHMEKMAVSLGVSVPQMRGFFENRTNFSDPQWAEMQMMKKEAMEETKAPVMTVRKKMHHNKHIKI